MTPIDRIKAALESDTPGRVEWRTQLESALFEIERLQATKTAALKVADERSKENVELRKALGDLIDAYNSDVNPNDRNETAIEHARQAYQ